MLINTWKEKREQNFLFIPIRASAIFLHLSEGWYEGHIDSDGLFQ